MPRFYCPAPLQSGPFTLTETVHRHVQVLRLAAGDTLVLFDGTGNEYPATLVEIGNKRSQVDIGEPTSYSRESPLTIHLAQGISSGDRMDYTLQKAVELGVSTIQPLFTRRSIVKLPPDRWAKKQLHWQNVVIAACEQCGRNTIPAVLEAKTLQNWLQHAHTGTGWILAPGGQNRLKQLAPQLHSTLLAGPEGGLTDEEETQAEQFGLQRLTLGPRILRTETAALAALAAMQALWGDG